MWGLVIEGAILLAAYAYHRWVQDHPTPPGPPGLTLPSVTEGVPIPLIYGQCRIRTPVMVWSGNYLVPGQTYQPWGATGPLTIDHYSVDILFLLGVPFYYPPSTSGPVVSAIFGMWYGDANVDTLITNDTGIVGTRGFFGGPGIQHPGDPTQFSVSGVFSQGDAFQSVSRSPAQPGGPAYPVLAVGGMFADGVVYDADTLVGRSLNSILTQAQSSGGVGAVDFDHGPGYRNQAMAYCHFGLGQSSSISGVSFEVRALGVGAQADFGRQQNNDADPAAVILDILTSPWGKVGLPLSAVDLTSFDAASLTLFNERHGYSRVFDSASDAWSMISEILRQIDAVLYPEPTTGLITLKLIRNDYGDPSALQNINPNNAKPDGSSWYKVQGWAETPNAVRVTYTDRTNNYADAINTGQTPSAAMANGGRMRSVSIQFKGCCTKDLAVQLTSRELAAVSRPLVQATVITDRSFYQARPGSVYTFTWPPLGVSNMVMRVASADLGQLHKGEIRLQLMRDQFDVKLGAYPPL